MCKSKHDNKHKIINYNDKEYICNIHNEKYNSYCKECKKNICLLCENNHNEHELIYYSALIIEDNKIIKGMEEIKREIEIFNNNIKEEIRKLNKIIENIEEYYKIIDNIIIKYINNKKRNYQILININKIINENNIINNIKTINNNNNKYNDIIDIYNKTYNNDIDKDIDNDLDNKDKDIDSNIKHNTTVKDIVNNKDKDKDIDNKKNNKDNNKDKDNNIDENIIIYKICEKEDEIKLIIIKII